MKIRPYFKHSRFKHSTVGVNYTPKQLSAFYGFSSVGDGSGKNVAVIELGGGFVQKDLDEYFAETGQSVKPVIFHGIGGAKNAPGDPNGADGEVMLDLCVIGGMAPGVQMHCYMAPNTDAGFLKAIQQAVADKMDAISISWGAPEDDWTSSAITSFNAAFQAAAAAGITVTAAAGDNGSTDGEKGSHVDFPASSPFVLGCGGTSLPSTSPVSEVVWNDGSAGGATGGGVSSLFPTPAWQKASNVPGGKARGVPDVAGVADPDTGWIVRVDGQSMVIGGTSAVAPMWAALSAVLGSALGKNVGPLYDKVYSLPAGCFRDITSGNNGTYVARSGYDCNTGNGVPVASRIFAALRGTVPVPPPVPVPVPVPATVRVLEITGATKITLDGKAV